MASIDFFPDQWRKRAIECARAVQAEGDDISAGAQHIITLLDKCAKEVVMASLLEGKDEKAIRAMLDNHPELF